MTEILNISDRLKLLDLCFNKHVGHIASALGLLDFFKKLNSIIDYNKDSLVIGNSNIPFIFNGFFNRSYDDIFNDVEIYPTCSKSLCKYLSIGLGNAIGIGAGMSLCNDCRTFITIGDSILHAGSELEACMFIGKNKTLFKNTVLCINNNDVGCISSFNNFGNELFNILTAFGWPVYVIDGHSLNELDASVEIINNKEKPLCLIVKTVKGKGISFIENDQVQWHYKILDRSEYDKARTELICLQ